MYLFGQATSGGGQATGGSPYTMLVMIGIMFAIFYFIIIMPAKKKQKQHQSLITSLKGGERVMTSGGIYGTISRVLEDRFEIEVDKGTKLQVTKTSISAVLDPQGSEKK